MQKKCRRSATALSTAYRVGAANNSLWFALILVFHMLRSALMEHQNQQIRAEIGMISTNTKSTPEQSCRLDPTVCCYCYFHRGPQTKHNPGFFHGANSRKTERDRERGVHAPRTALTAAARSSSSSMYNPASAPTLPFKHPVLLTELVELTARRSRERERVCWGLTRKLASGAVLGLRPTHEEKMVAV